MLRIRTAQPLRDHWLRLVLTDGSVIDRDVSDLLHGPAFDGLRSDAALFRKARVRGGTVVWPGDLDLDPNVLIWNGDPPHESGAHPLDSLRLTHPDSVISG